MDYESAQAQGKGVSRMWIGGLTRKIWGDRKAQPLILLASVHISLLVNRGNVSNI